MDGKPLRSRHTECRPLGTPSRLARLRYVHAVEQGALLYRVRRSNAGRNRVGTRRSRRTDRCASCETRSRASIPRTARRAITRRQPRASLFGRRYPRLSELGRGFAPGPSPPALAPEGPERVAVRTDELTLRDLAQNLVPRMTPRNRADVVHLLEPWKVVPLHRLSRESPPAVSAGSAGLEALQPRPSRWSVLRLRSPRNGASNSALVPPVIDLGSADLAVHLPAVRTACAPVEIGPGLHRGAAEAPLYCPHREDPDSTHVLLAVSTGL